MKLQIRLYSLSWKTRVDLQDKQVELINALGIIADAKKVNAETMDGTKRWMTAQFILNVAVGSRPTFLDILGAREHGISTDSLFSLEREPEKTLVVGAGGELVIRTLGF